MTAPTRFRPGARLIPCGTLAGLALLYLAVACAEQPTSATSERDVSGSQVANLDASDRTRDVSTQGALVGKLPSTDTVTSSVPAFEIKQKGGGIAGRFEITNPNSAAIALDGVHSGSGHALLAWNLGLGRGAVIITSNSLNTLPALDVSSQSLGTTTLAAAADIRANNVNATAPAVSISTLGRGPAGKFEVKNASSISPALTAIDTIGTGPAGLFRAKTNSSNNSAVIITNSGNGRGLLINHTGSAGHLAVFQTAGANKARIDRLGKGFFNGGTQTGGADLAEAFDVEGSADAYEPGDVLVISTRSDRRVTTTDEPYSTRVVGVYATKPGVLLTDRDVDDSLEGMVPLGIVGVIPTKVSAENGAIRRGDLLVTARTPGHAMRGTERDRMLGAVIGKALAEFPGPGMGVIQVFINVR